MRSMAQIADDVIALREHPKYAFMSPEVVAQMLVVQQLERIADALEAARVGTPITLVQRYEPVVDEPVGIANQRSAEAPVIPSFTGTIRANQPKRK